jgi:hypothetical protein
MKLATGQRRLTVASVALAALAGCDPGSVTLFQPLQDSGPASPVVEVTLLLPDGSPAPESLVHYLRVEPFDYKWHAARTDDSGRLTLELSPGFLYWLAGEYDGGFHGTFGGGQRVWVEKGDSLEVVIPLRTPRTTGVAISEVAIGFPFSGETGGQAYQLGQYIELANLGEEVVYLDGMLVGRAYHWWTNTEQYGHHRCADTESMRNDPDGIWSQTMWRFPGSGTEHPLLPGEAAMIAVVAADHRPVHPSLLDLSAARFEFGWPGYADNPSAANLIRLGPSESTGLGAVDPFWFVASPTDFDALPEALDPGAGNGNAGSAPQPHRRVPREAIQDVAFLWNDNTGSYSGILPSPPCTDPVHVSFDAIPGGFQKSNDLYRSRQRRRVTVEGRSILLDTNTSQVDFMLAERTPGWLP